VETSLTLGYNETSAKRQLARSGLVPLIPTALVGRNGNNNFGNTRAALPDVVVDLLVDLLVAFHQFLKQFTLVLLLLQLVVDIVLQKLLLV
jgi:hypothetical protein